MISDNEKSILVTFIQHPGFRLQEQIARELIQQKKESSNLAETEWETAKNAAVERGFIDGINTLVQEVIRKAQ